MGEDILYEIFARFARFADRLRVFPLTVVCRTWMKILCEWTFSYTPPQLGPGFDIFAPHMLAPLQVSLSKCGDGTRIDKLLRLPNLTKLDVQTHSVPVTVFRDLTNLKHLLISRVKRKKGVQLGTMNFLPPTCEVLTIAPCDSSSGRFRDEMFPGDVEGLCDVKELHASFSAPENGFMVSFRAPVSLTHCQIQLTDTVLLRGRTTNIKCDFFGSRNLKRLTLQKGCIVDRFHPDICLEDLQWSGSRIAQTLENQRVFLAARCIGLCNPTSADVTSFPGRQRGANLLDDYHGDIRISSTDRMLSDILDEAMQTKVRLVEWITPDDAKLRVRVILKDLCRASANLRHLEVLRLQPSNFPSVSFDTIYSVSSAKIDFLPGLATILDNCKNLKHLIVPEEAVYCPRCMTGPGKFEGFDSDCACICRKLDRLEILEIVPIRIAIEVVVPSISHMISHVMGGSGVFIDVTLLDLRQFRPQQDKRRPKVSYYSDAPGNIRDARQIHHQKTSYTLVKR